MDIEKSLKNLTGIVFSDKVVLVFRFISRIKQLGQFWKHLNTSGYGSCNETYTKLLIDRLEFHRKVKPLNNDKNCLQFPVMPGNLNLNESQIKTLESDLDNAFEMTISMLDEMDNLLLLQQKGIQLFS